MDDPSMVKKPLAAFLNEKFRENDEREGPRTPADMARKMDISPAAISRWRYGAEPDFDQCLRIASYFREDPRVILSMIQSSKAADWITLFDSFAAKSNVIRHNALHLACTDDEEHDLLEKVQDILAIDPQGGGKAIFAIVEQLTILTKFRKLAGDIESPKKENDGKEKTGTRTA